MYPNVEDTESKWISGLTPDHLILTSLVMGLTPARVNIILSLFAQTGLQ